MIVGKSFEGDDNDALQWAQHDRYSEALGIIIQEVIRIHNQACMILDADPPIKKDNDGHIRYDHRDMQAAHDHLAAYWRVISGYSGDQLNLKSISEQAEEWIDWLRKEVKEWFDWKPVIICEIVNMLTHRDNPRESQNAGEDIYNSIESYYDIPS